MLFQSFKTEEGKYISLDEYIEAMPDGQNDLYYITGENRKEAEQSSHLEIFKENDQNVLYFLEPVDEIMIQTAFEYKGKKFKSILKGDIDLGKKDEEEVKKQKEKFQSLIDLMKEALKEDVKDVRFSDRLRASASCLVADEHDMGVHMEKIMKAYNQDTPTSKRILEINPKHQVIEKMQSLYEANNSDPVIKDYAGLIYDQALIAEGSKIPDPAKFNQRLYDLMMK